MSKIVLVARDEVPGQVIADIRQLTDISMIEIQSCIREGRHFFEAELFGNDHLEVSGRLRALIEVFLSAGIHLDLFELLPEESTSLPYPELCKMDSVEVLNVLDASDGTFL